MINNHGKRSREPFPQPASPSDSDDKEYFELEDEHTHVARKRTTVEKELRKHRVQAHELVVHLPDDNLPTVQAYVPQTLSNAIFCGHLVTDLDSIAGAIGAAELYGGIPARASEVNSETAFALKLWRIEQPRPIEELLVEYPKAGVCLVDHQQTSQLNKAIDVNRIVGVIDHHALQNATIVTDMPIYIDIRPWGSMSTIIAHQFFTLGRRPKRATCGLLLCAILSDTLNLQGPTTTEWDRLMVAALNELAGVEDLQQLASNQFKAKSSELANLSSMNLINGDQKVFSFKTDNFEGSFGFAVIETTDDEVILNRSAELLMALSEDKEIKKLDGLFLAVVNIVKLRSNLLLCGDVERSLAERSFVNGKMVDAHMMDIGGLVSRKKDFVPAITAAVKKGWSKPVQSIAKKGVTEAPYLDRKDSGDRLESLAAC